MILVGIYLLNNIGKKKHPVKYAVDQYLTYQYKPPVGAATIDFSYYLIMIDKLRSKMVNKIEEMQAKNGMSLTECMRSITDNMPSTLPSIRKVDIQGLKARTAMSEPECVAELQQEEDNFIDEILEVAEAEIIDEPSRRHIPSSVKREVWRRDKGRCVKCGSRERLEYDHIIPVAKGGSNTVRNIELLCEECNRKKRDKIE